MRALKPFCFIFFPVLIIYGVCRFAFSGQFGIPSASDFQEAFMSFNGVQIFMTFGDKLNAINTDIGTSFASVTDWNSFWNAMGTFFQSVGSFFYMVFSVIFIPIETLIWVIRFLVGAV